MAEISLLTVFQGCVGLALCFPHIGGTRRQEDDSALGVLDVIGWTLWVLAGKMGLRGGNVNTKHPHEGPQPPHLPLPIKFNQSKLPESRSTITSQLQIKTHGKTIMLVLVMELTFAKL